MKPPEEFRRYLAKLSEEKAQKEHALRQATLRHKKDSERVRLCKEWIEVSVASFKDLKECWRRIQLVQFLELTKLGLSTSALVPGVRRVSKELSKGTVTRVLDAGPSVPTAHL
jgi:hypothetical protein